MAHRLHIVIDRMTTGSCLCGAVRFEASGPFAWMMHCHCSLCRRHQGGLYSTWTGVAKRDFRWLGGEADIVRYRSSPAVERAFCRHCGSKVAIETLLDTMMIPAGTLHQDPGIRPSAHIFVGSKSPVCEINDDLPQFEAFPPGVDRAPIDSRDASASAGPQGLGGGCLCGSVAFEIDRLPDKVTNCHCTRCQRSRGAAHATNVFVHQEQFRWHQGTEHVTRYELPGAQLFSTSFCSRCGSLLPSLFAGIKRYNVPAGSLEGVLETKPRLHIHVQSRAAWHTITDDLPQFAEMPPLDRIKEWMF